MEKVKHRFKNPFHFRDLSLTAQIFIVFAGFIVILIFSQYIVYQIMFSDYFINSQKRDIDASLQDLITELRTIDNDNYYNELIDYAKDTNSLNVVLNQDFALVNPVYNSLAINVIDTNNYQTYEVTLPDGVDISASDRVVCGVKKDEYNNNYTMYSLIVNSEEVYASTETDLEMITGIVQKVKRPLNCNSIYSNNQLVINELFNLRNTNHIIKLDGNSSYTYIRTTDISQNIIYVSDIGNDNYLLSIFVISTNTSLLNIFNDYNLAVYSIITIIAIAISVIVALSISKPIIRIDNVAKEISKKNFNVYANEGQNKETRSLSNSINVMNKNLSSTINELTATNEKITNMYKMETQQVAIRKRFIQAISHELKTPLMVINLSVSGILDNIFNEKEKEVELKRVLSEVTNVDIMIKDLLDVYKIDDIESADKQEKINLRHITDTAIISIDNMLKQYNQNISVSSTRAPIVYGNQKLIQMCINNIIINAVKYTPVNENITVLITEKKDKIKFSCTNYGVQIPDEKIEHVFEAFYRVDESRTKTSKTKGTGLGLYIFSETMRAHGFEYGIKNIRNGVCVYFIAKKYN